MKKGLPYINNIPIVLITVVINIAVTFIFFWGRPIGFWEVIIDAAYCGAITTIINSAAVITRVKKLRAKGQLPQEVPVSKIMMKMPKNPVLLAIVFGVLFAAITAFFSFIVMEFFQKEVFTFPQFLVWKVLYSCYLSIKITELMILRYVQKDYVSMVDVVQKGSDTVKDPLPKISTFKQWFNSITEDFGFNMIIGLFFGGTIIQGKTVILPPISVHWVWISAIILGTIVAFRLAYPVAKKILGLREAGELEIKTENDKRFSWIPYSPMKFAMILIIPIIVFAFLIFWGIMVFFGFEEVNFFQFWIIRLIFITLLTKPVVNLAIMRYIQPKQK